MSLPLSLSLQIILLIVLILLIAVLTASERVLATHKRLAASRRKQRLHELLAQIDQTSILLQLFKYLFIVLASLLAAHLSLQLLAQPTLWQVALAVASLVLVLILVAEVLPRKLAQSYPETTAYQLANFYSILLTLTWPLIPLLNACVNLILKLCQQPTDNSKLTPLSSLELRQLVELEGVNIPAEHLAMLTRILDLDSSCVEDIMIPRHQLVGIDLAKDWTETEQQIIHSLFTRVLVYEESVDNILGFVHLKRLLPLLAEQKLDREHLKATIRPAYFVPKGASLLQQLLNFREQARRSAIVVDEYGDILGMLALEDILEEIVGEFSTVPIRHEHTIQIRADGSAWLDGATSIRDINQSLNLQLPTDGPKTINGLIMEHLESLPVPGMTVLIEQHPMEIRKTRNNAIKTLIIYPAIQATSPSGAEHGKS